MTSCQISLAAKHLFLAFVLLKQEILSEGTYYKKKKFKCGRPLKEESCNDAWLVIWNKSIDVVCWRKHAGRRNLNAMFVWEILKTLC